MPTFENGGNPKSATSLSFVRRRELILSWSSTVVSNHFFISQKKDVKAKGQPHLIFFGPLQSFAKTRPFAALRFDSLE